VRRAFSLVDDRLSLSVQISPKRVAFCRRYGSALDQFLGHISSDGWERSLKEVVELIDGMQPWEWTAWLLVAHEKALSLDGPSWDSERDFWLHVSVVQEVDNEDEPGLGDTYEQAAKAGAAGEPEECLRLLAVHRDRTKRSRRKASPPAPAGETSPEPHREEPPDDH
jgi:hypothetical protein